MTDKQIIDGVDVSGCEWISEVGLDSEYICTCNSPNKTSGYCKYNPNCCYKQLKRKEQECEELRGVIRKDICSHYVLGECSQKHHNNCVGRNQCIKDLEQECEELKKCYKNNSALLDFEETNTTKLVNKVMKLEKTLAEIKEIAQYDVYTSRTDLCLKLNWIKKKISEVEE